MTLGQEQDMTRIPIHITQQQHSACVSQGVSHSGSCKREEGRTGGKGGRPARVKGGKRGRMHTAAGGPDAVKTLVGGAGEGEESKPHTRADPPRQNGQKGRRGGENPKVRIRELMTETAEQKIERQRALQQMTSHKLTAKFI